MVKPVPKSLISFLREGERFIIAGHKEPDGDCIGCQLALASLLKRMGKETVLVSAGPFKRTEIKPFEKFFKLKPAKKDMAAARVIIVDCGNLERTGDLAPCLEGLPLAVVDHHQSGKDKANVIYTDSNAQAATLLVLRIIEALKIKMTKEEAEYLFFGLCTDTGFFRHVDDGHDDVFEAAKKLVRAGANPKAAFMAINGGKSLDSRRLIANILLSAELYFDGKLIVSTERYEETCRYGYEGRDSDNIYRLLLTVAGVKAVALIRQETPEKCTVGLRSVDTVDVSAVAEIFGGGGHRSAAAFAREGTIAELKPKIINTFETFFQPASGSGKNRKHT